MVPPTTGHNWAQVLAPYRTPNLYRGLLELSVTFVLLVVFWVLAWVALFTNYVLSCCFIIPAATFLARLFVIQHDCGHGAFFRGRKANDWVGRIIGVLTLTSYSEWKMTHALHHARSGNLDRRGVGDIRTLTVREFEALSPFAQRLYRINRHPLIILGLGPAYLFLFRHRLPRTFRAPASRWIGV